MIRKIKRSVRKYLEPSKGDTRKIRAEILRTRKRPDGDINDVQQCIDTLRLSRSLLRKELKKIGQNRYADAILKSTDNLASKEIAELTKKLHNKKKEVDTIECLIKSKQMNARHLFTIRDLSVVNSSEVKYLDLVVGESYLVSDGYGLSNFDKHKLMIIEAKLDRKRLVVMDLSNNNSEIINARGLRFFKMRE